MPVKTKKIEKTHEEPVFEGRYTEAIGGRKRSCARVRLYEEKKEGKQIVIVNGKTLQSYFPTEEMQKIAEDAFRKTRPETRFRVSAKVKGGGIHSQAEALRHGISRSLTKFDAQLRQKLKSAGFLTRDSRSRERKKFGLKRARRAPQWSKR